jgi:hypothetical protein
MTDFDATQSYRIRAHISEASTQKDKGKLIRDVTVENSNQDTRQIIKDKQDIANVKNADVATQVFDIWDRLTEEGHKRGKVFIDEIEKDV